jgi:hypothetical protein
VSGLDVATSLDEFIWFDVSLIKLRLHSRFVQRIREAYVGVLVRIGLSTVASLPVFVLPFEHNSCRSNCAERPC